MAWISRYGSTGTVSSGWCGFCWWGVGFRLAFHDSGCCFFQFSAGKFCTPPPPITSRIQHVPQMQKESRLQPSWFAWAWEGIVLWAFACQDCEGLKCWERSCRLPNPLPPVEVFAARGDGLRIFSWQFLSYVHFFLNVRKDAR